MFYLMIFLFCGQYFLIIIGFFLFFLQNMNLLKGNLLVLFHIFLVNFYAQQELTWEFYHPIKKEWLAFGKAGSIQEKLIELGELPDPFFGDNEKLYQWIEEHEWKFRSTFYLTDKELSAESLVLNFPNIDTYGELTINETFLRQTTNFFHPYDFEIKDLAKSGYNTVYVTITPPTLYHKSRYENESFHYPAPNDPAKIKAAPLTRKPQFQFGWDWSLRMNTIGFSNPVQLITDGTNSIQHCVVNTLYQSSNVATLLYVLDTKVPMNGGAISSALFGVHPLIMDSLPTNRFQFDFQLENPKLWWPIGFGEPNLYTDTLRLLNSKGEVLDQLIIDFGVRTAQLVQTKDEWGTSYEFQVNDVPIFCKGANYIPQSVFPAAVKDLEIENMIDQMIAANFNMVRVWGGGYYPGDVFYETCDKKGLLVWQDLMFACAMYPGDSDFLNNVETELNYQIPRITAHPSVILINGNNEVDVAWKNWGFQLQYSLSDKSQKVIEKAYTELFHTLANKVVSAWTSTSYIHTSPLSNWGKDELYNHGSQHYWGVWHGTDPMSNFATKIGRFNAEYGFQSFPEYSTLSSFSDRKDWDLNSNVMKHHQKSYVGNGMILKHTTHLFGEPKSFEEFVYLAQLTQAHAVSTAINGHRLDAPRCMGTLYWQLNDCWPAPTWSSIDYYGNWKALHYAVRDDYRQVAILKKTDSNGNVQLFLKSDDPKSNESAVQVVLEVYNLDGVMLSNSTQKLSIDYMEQILLGTFKQQNQVVKVLVGNKYERSFLLSQQKSFQENAKYVLSIENIDLTQKTGTLRLENTDFMADVWFYSSVLGVHFNNNFEHFLPGVHLIPFIFTNQIGDIKLMNR
jgi:beta-mannosidase